jgi:diguanylate cyclase (GGDEF)-like protein
LRLRLLPLLRRPFRNLPSRIIFSVFGAAIVTSLVVTLVSTSSIESFLSDEIDRKFPAILQSTARRLDLWYSQRRLDIETFARSATVIENVTLLGKGKAGRLQVRAEAELRQYLTYVLERFPQYEALFVLDDAGNELLRVGIDVSLPDALRAGLAGVAGSRVGGTHAVGGRHVQFASSPVVGPRQRRLGSLHALVQLAALVPVLDDEDLGETGAIYVVDGNGRTLIQSQGSAPRPAYRRELPAPKGAPEVEDYASTSGEHVVGSAVRAARFGWIVVVEESYEAAFAPVDSVIRRILAINLGIVLLFGIAAYQFARSIVRPIQALSEGARRIAEGESNVVVPLPATQDEIEVLTRVFNEMSERLQRNQLELEESRLEIERANDRLITQNEELQRVNEVLEQLSITDGLTKLHNHRFFQDYLRREMKRAKRTGESLSLVLIDIDDFKQFNDRFGHAAGDAMLRHVADVMNGVIREMDLLARYGGEEFAILASQTDLEGACTLGEKVRLAVADARFQPAGEDGKPVTVAVSVGVSSFYGDEKAFFNEADRALYRAKAKGKDCVVASKPRAQRRRKRSP